MNVFVLFFMVCKGSGTSQTTGAFTSLVVNLLSVVLPRALAFASASQMLVRQCGVTPNYVQVNTVAYNVYINLPNLLFMMIVLFCCFFFCPSRRHSAAHEGPTAGSQL